MVMKIAANLILPPCSLLDGTCGGSLSRLFTLSWDKIARFGVYCNITCSSLSFLKKLITDKMTFKQSYETREQRWQIRIFWDGVWEQGLGIVLVFFKLTSLFSRTAKVENCYPGL